MNQLRTARQARGWTQARAAARLGVSQPYLAMLEAGQRPLTSAVARRAMRVYSLPPTVLPPGVAPRVGAATLAQDLAALGYPGFVHLTRRGCAAKHPGAVLLTALAQPELEARAVEALPWLLLRYWSLDPAWLVREAKVRDLQNRLGFVVSLAREVAVAQVLEPLNTAPAGGRMTLTVSGNSFVAVRYGLSRPTADLDYLEVNPYEHGALLQELAGPGGALTTLTRFTSST